MLKTMAAAALVLGLAGATDAAGKKKAAAPTNDQIFARLDANSDGHLSMDEFKNVVTELGAANAPAKANAKKPAAPAAKIDVAAAFKKLDTNSDGQLSAAEFKTVATAIAPAAAPAKKVKKAK